MNKRIYFLSVGIIIFTALFYFIYFAGDSCSGLEGNKATIINIHYERGVRFYKQGEYDKAIKELEKVLEIDSEHLKAKKYLAAATKSKNKKILEELCIEADAFYKQREYQKAMDTYKKALEVKPGDGYVSYRMALVNAKIDKLKEVKKNTQAKLKQSKKELERLTKERGIRERLLKKRVELELDRKEKEAQKKETGIAKEGLDKTLSENIALESQVIPKKEAKLARGALKPDTFALSKDIEQDAFLSEQIKGLEKLYRIKFLFELGEKYYNEGDYHRAIETFRQVIDLEVNLKINYTPYAQDYIERAKEKLQEQIKKDRAKEVQDVENEMINKIIDEERVTSETK